MDTKMKLRFPHSLLSTLSSCKTQNLIADVSVTQQQQQQQERHIVIEPQSFIFSCSPKSYSSEPQIIPHSSSNSIEPLLPQYSPSPAAVARISRCKPRRCSGSFDEMVRDNCIFASDKILPSANFGGIAGWKCPPASPAASSFTQYNKILPLPMWKEDEEMMRMRRRRRRRRRRRAKLGEKKKKKKSVTLGAHMNSFWFSSDDEREYSSFDDEEEDDTDSESETLFSSSRSLLSLSSVGSSNSDTTRSSMSMTRRKGRGKNINKNKNDEEKKKCEEVGAKVEGSFAVVKSSSDPYGDFRSSMVEMVMERQIFGADGLEELLQCFLSLNSAHHHRVIIEVFMEIWDALFSN